MKLFLTKVFVSFLSVTDLLHVSLSIRHDDRPRVDRVSRPLRNMTTEDVVVDSVFILFPDHRRISKVSVHCAAPSKAPTSVAGGWGRGSGEVGGARTELSVCSKLKPLNRAYAKLEALCTCFCCFVVFF